MNKDNTEEILRHALKELEDEEFRKLVDKRKQELRTAKWWWKFFPWVITIRRRNV